MRALSRQARPGLLLAALLAVLAAPASADIYAGHDATGTAVFSDRPGDGLSFYLGTDDLPADSPARRQAATAFHAGMQRHDRQIRQAALEQGLDPALLHAVVQVESGYNPRAVSPKGAVGLMQLMPATARELGVRDSADPKANLRGGARYLRSLMAAFDGDLQLALAAYNAGETTVRRHAMQVPPFAETRSYVAAVLKRYQALKRLL
jgi:soluble lytic murein transglycosylase-like protein